MKQIEKQLKALANQKRLMILKFLKKEKKASVWEIADKIDLSIKSTSRHLAILRSVDLVKGSYVGKEKIYSLETVSNQPSKYIIGML